MVLPISPIVNGDSQEYEESFVKILVKNCD